MVSTSDESNIVYVKARSINEVSTVNAQTVNSVKNVVSYNDKSHIYEQQAKAHATTAKHYADVAKNYAENSKEAEIWAEGTDEEVKALGGTHSAKTWAEILASGTVGQWGNILGDITEQYDLMEQLDSKANTEYVNELVEGFESSLGDKVSTEDFNTAVGSFSEAISLKQDNLTAGENITIVDNVISAEDGINNKVTNCILVMPENAISNPFGTTFHLSPDIKALIPNGRNTDGTLKNIEWTNENEIMQNVTLYGDAHHLIYHQTSGVILHSKFLGSFSEVPQVGGSNGCYYNTTENKIYFNGGHQWVEAPIVLLAEVWAEGQTVVIFKPKQPFKAVDYEDFSKLETLPHITQTYSNGDSWYRIYSDGWCEQGGYNDGAKELATITLLLPFKDTQYTVLTGRFVLGTADDDASISYQARNITTTSFQIRQTYSTATGDGSGSGTSYAYKWEAKGYIR